MRYQFLSAFLLLFLIACENKNQETRADRISKGFCDCATPLLLLNKQAAEADSIDFEAIQAAYEKAKTCFVEQRMKPEDLPEVQKSLAVKCPELAAQTELLQELLGK